MWAPWRLMADVAPSMIERGEGWIVNLTSFAAELPPGPPFPTNLVAQQGAGYGSTKAALNRLTVSVASELHPHGIAVNAVGPQSAIATPHLLARGDLDPLLFEPLETMAEAVLLDSGAVLPVCAWLDGEYGISGVYLGVQAELGRGGVRRIVETPLSAVESEALRDAAAALAARP